MRVLLSLLFLFISGSTFAQSKKLKVYILAGQSNMEGHAKTPTLEYMADDPKTLGFYKELKTESGYAEAKKTWITYFTGNRNGNGEGFGKLTTGYGSRKNPQEDGGKIGPEYTLGLTLDKKLDGPVLIIKTAWGGKSLFYDYRPPSAGTYQQTEEDKEKGRNTPEKSGHYYRLMKGHVNKVLKNIKRVYPDYDGSGYEIAGFVWFQGWNDMVNRGIYPILPKGSKEMRFKKYGELMAHFIRDVRKDFNAPKMPFIIGVMGVNGMEPKEGNKQFREGMALPTTMPEFKGNVATVQTGLFWDKKLGEIDEKRFKVKQMSYFLRIKHKKHANKDGNMSKRDQQEYLKKYEAEVITAEERAMWQKGASNAGYHYLGCGKTFALMGRAFAEKLIEMNSSK